MILAVSVREDDLLERRALPPADGFEHGGVGKLLGVADAKVGHGHDVLWQAEFRGQCRVIDDAYPTHADTFGARGEPQILHSTTGAEEVRVQDRVPAEHLPAALSIAGNADVERRFE